MSEGWAAWWAAQNLPAIEWLACALSFAYVYLAAKNSVWCWPLAFLGSCLWAWEVWTAYDLVFDTALNVFYAAMAVVGLLRWARADEAGTSGALPISRMRRTDHLALIAQGSLITFALFAGAMSYFPTAAMPALDAATTVFSVLATFLLIGRRLENWLYFLVVDLVYVYIYLERGSVIFAATFVIYAVMAVYGYRAWRKELGALLARSSRIRQNEPNRRRDVLNGSK